MQALSSRLIAHPPAKEICFVLPLWSQGKESPGRGQVLNPSSQAPNSLSQGGVQAGLLRSVLPHSLGLVEWEEGKSSVLQAGALLYIPLLPPTKLIMTFQNTFCPQRAPRCTSASAFARLLQCLISLSLRLSCAPFSLAHYKT